MNGGLLQWQMEVWAGKQMIKVDLYLSGSKERSLEEDQLRFNMVGIYKQAGWGTTVV